MNKFEVTILGCGSALPTMQHMPTSQVVNIREKLFMIDCGEATQLQFRKAKLGFNKLSQIFISHLHGDHCFGLIGLISTLSLLGRTGDLTIHAIPDLERILQPQLDFFCQEMSYKIIFKSFDHTKNEVIYDDRSVRVSTIPLDHRVPCAGFLFEEKESEPHLNGEAIRFYKIPIKELSKIKKGADFICDDGAVISNNLLTKPTDPVRKYAFCSDTAYSESIIPIIKQVDLLYHESTFLESSKSRANQTKHSTAMDAARIACSSEVKKLMLGHYSSRYSNDSLFKDEAETIFSNIVLANEQLVEKL